MGRRKPFIDKQNAAHFTLVHNHNDAGDGEAPSRVLMPFVPVGKAKKGEQVSERAMDFADSVNYSESKPKVVEEDLEGDCYFPKDGYDYEQHLKTMSDQAFLVEQSQEQQDALNYAVAKTKQEREVLEALAHADDYDSADDDFFDGLLGAGPAEDTHEMLWGKDDDAMASGGPSDPFGGAENLPDLDLHEYLGSESEDDLCELPVRANRDLDDELLHVLEEYGDEFIGELEEEDAVGRLDMSSFQEVLDDYVGSRTTYRAAMEQARKEADEEDNVAIHAHLGLDRDDENCTSGSDDDYEVREVTLERDWDVESVASMRSNLSNHPGRIDRIKVHGKPKKERKAVALEPIGEDNTVELPEVDTFRPKNESLEDKKARKQAVKEQRRLCREMKKANKLVWKEETAKIVNRAAAHGADVRAGVRVMPI